MELIDGTNLNREQFIDLLENGVCPYCLKGNFLMVANHISQIHGIDRIELRRIAGINRHHRLCEETFADECRQRALERGLGVKDGLQGSRAPDYNMSKKTKVSLEAREHYRKIRSTKEYKERICKTLHTEQSREKSRDGLIRHYENGGARQKVRDRVIKFYENQNIDFYRKLSRDLVELQGKCPAGKIYSELSKVYGMSRKSLREAALRAARYKYLIIEGKHKPVFRIGGKP